MVAVAIFSTSLLAQDFTWIQTSGPTIVPPNQEGGGIASASDGTKLVAAVYNGGIYTSTNSGATWTQQTNAPNANWMSVASSADGTILVAITLAYSGGIYTSTNSGMTWTKTSAPTTNFWWAVASSSDGTKLAAANDSGYSSGGGIYTSQNSGTSWTRTASGGVTISVASSSDGNTLIAGQNFFSGYLYVSVNSGNTWTESGVPNAADSCAVAASANGTELIAAALGCGIYISTNSGTSWTQTSAPTNQAWDSVAASSDGTRLVAGSFFGEIYASTNSGMSWRQQTVPTNHAWAAIASSSDGTKVVAAAGGGGIWIGQFSPQIIQQPQNVLSCPGDSSILTVAASGTLSLNYQWQKNGTNLVDNGNVMGSATTNLTLLNLSQSDSANYDVVITNTVGSITSSVAILNVNLRPAQATPIVINGFIVGATLTDGGCGYTNPPAIVFCGQGGSNATAYAQISNGSVTNIVITNTGSAYPANSVALFAPPIYPVLSIVQTLTNTPSAAASPVVSNGFIVGAILSAAGSGYPTNPAVSFSDASGHGAAAYSQISSGAVTNIVITSTGSGYSSKAVVNIAPTPTINVVIPSANNLMLGQNYQLQIADGLTGWTGFGAAFSATSPAWTPTNFWNVANTNSVFFRLQMLQ